MKTIGFIGTGLIGNPMARRLLTQGFHLKAHDYNPQSLQSVLDAGAEPVQGPADFQDTDAVLIVVNNMDQVNECFWARRAWSRPGRTAQCRSWSS